MQLRNQFVLLISIVDIQIEPDTKNMQRDVHNENIYKYMNCTNTNILLTIHQIVLH